jgi:hypothetical protein
MRYLGFFLAIFFLNSCVSVPKEAPELSENLGNELQALENSHLNLLHLFFENERKEIREFIDDEWLPLFATNFFKEPAIENVWQQVVSSGDEEDRLQFIVRTAPKLQQQINLKYQELITPLNQLENKLTSAIQAKYTNAKSINQSLTSYLYSASKVEENRQRYLTMIGVSEDENEEFLNETEQLTERLLSGAETAQEAEDKIEAYKEKLDEILAKL